MIKRVSKTRVRIYRFDSGEAPLDVSDDLLACQWSRSMTADGAFSLSLVPNTHDWGSVIPVGSWIRIEQQCGPDMAMRTRMWGRIDQVGKTSRSASQDGARIRQVTISGRDHSSVLVDSAIEFAPYLTERLQARGVDAPPVPLLSRDVTDAFEVALTEAVSGTPDAFFRFIYDAFFRKAICGGQVFALPTSMGGEAGGMGLDQMETAVDMIDLVVGRHADSLAAPGMKGIAFDQTIVANQAGGRMWDLLKEWSNPAMNELFFPVDPVTSRPRIQFRERPFPCYTIRENGPAVLETRDWEKLPGVEIPEGALSAYAVGKNDFERVNWFFLFAENIGFSQEDQILLAGESYLRGAPIIDIDSAARYGLRRFEQSTRYIGYDGPQAAVRWLIPATYWLTQLYCWYSLNHEYFSGSATVPYLERGDVGQRMWVLGDDGLYTEYYIEGISTSWQKVPNGGTIASTSFILTRGVPGISGRLVRGPNHDYVQWDIRDAYPLPTTPPADVQILLDAAARETNSWTDAESVRTGYNNENFSSVEEVFQGPAEYQDFVANQVPVKMGEEGLEDEDSIDDTHVPVEGYYEATENSQVFDQELSAAYQDPGAEGQLVSVSLIPSKETLRDKMDRYQELLEDNGIVALQADTLCYLHNWRAVESIAQSHSGWFFNDRRDRTRYAVPPESWWYHIMPACLIFQAAVARAAVLLAEDGLSVLTVTTDMFRCYNGFRPAVYNDTQGPGMVNGSLGSRHRFNHAIDVRLGSAYQGTYAIQSGGSTQNWSTQGECFWRALSEVAEEFSHYRPYIIQYVETGDGDTRRYQTHIDAAFYGGVRAPDDSRNHDDSDSHHRSGVSVHRRGVSVVRDTL